MNILTTFKIKKRSAVSQVIGSLFMLAIVAAIGSILVISGMENITNFNSILDTFKAGTSKSVQEIIKVEHVRFEPTSKNITVWIRNIGTTDVIISRISIVKIDTQELIVRNATLDLQIFPDELKSTSFVGNDVVLPSSCEMWNCKDGTDKRLNDSLYQISIATINDNYFRKIVQPFNS